MDFFYEKKRFYITFVIFLIFLLLPNIFSILTLSYPIWLQFILSVIIMLLFLKMYLNDFKEGFADFKAHFIKYIGIVLLFVIIWFILNLACNYVISAGLNQQIPNNGLSEYLFTNHTFYFIILSFIISPIMESTFIPMSFHKIINSKYAYYAICSFAYGILYVIFSIKNPMQLLYIFSYSITGFLISYMYDKYKNIMLPILFKIMMAVVFLITFIP